MCNQSVEFVVTEKSQLQICSSRSPCIYFMVWNNSPYSSLQSTMLYVRFGLAAIHREPHSPRAGPHTACCSGEPQPTRWSKRTGSLHSLTSFSFLHWVTFHQIMPFSLLPDSGFHCPWKVVLNSRKNTRQETSLGSKLPVTSHTGAFVKFGGPLVSLL